MFLCPVQIQGLNPLLARFCRPMRLNGINRLMAAVAFVLMVTTTLPHAVRAEVPAEADGRRTIDAVKRVVAKGQSLEKNGYGFFSVGTFFATCLDRGKSIQESWEMSQGTQYAFLAAGDEGVTKVTVEIHDGSGRVVGTHTAGKGSATATFKAPKTGRYTVIVHLVNADAPDGFCALAAMQKGGASYALHDPEVVDALGTVLLLSASISQSLNEKAINARFHRGGGWALHANMMKMGEGMSTDSKRLEPGIHAFLAVADDRCSDLDFELEDGSGGPLKRGKDDGRLSSAIYSNEESGSFRFALKNNYSTARVLAVCVVMDLVPQPDFKPE